jgi:FkbM family methyltransferase
MIVVQIGTNTGNDHVLRMCKEQEFEMILLVEPFDIHNQTIHSNYSGIANYTIDNVAIVPTSTPWVDLYYTDNDGPANHPKKSFEVASIRPDHLVKHNYSYHSLSKVRVPSLTMNEYLDKYSLRRIDYLFLDIEGIDFEVLETIDFDRFDIRNLQIEHLHLDFTQLVRFMASKGYSPREGIDLCGYDTMFLKN